LLLAPPSADAGTLFNWWWRQDIDVSFLVTPLAELALSQSARQPRLRTLLTGGDRLSPLKQAVPFELVNNYGPTECTVVATSGTVVGHSIAPSIGRPVDNTQIYMLDQRGREVPTGVAGEIHIGGVQVARGYLNRPDLTAEKFIPNPFGEPGSRMYKTGDLARYLPDGNIEFLGRIDHQVKIRGFRIELGEVEAALQRCERVREAVVLAREDEPGNKRLVAYVVPMAGTLAVTELRTQLSAFLPEYMVPSAWVVLDNLPLNPSGKIDRKALPAPELSRDVLGVEYVAPRNSTEELLAGIWAEVLKIERIGAHDNFFALGGHSLLAAQALRRTREVLGVKLDLRLVFLAPTLGELAACISALQSPRPSVSRPTGDRRFRPFFHRNE
jgi:acyl-coenzyme A synthetase/AMP-(fatty) acid ligase